MGHAPENPPFGVWGALDDLVTRVVDTRRQIAALQAQEAGLLAEAVDLVIARTAERRAEGRKTETDLALREVTSELGAAMRLSDRTVQARMSDASTLTVMFADTYQAWQAGAIDAGHVSAIIDAGAPLSEDEARAIYERIVLDAAAHETPPRLRAIARVVAARVAPETSEDAHRRARTHRKVRLIDLGEGMARLLADLPATLAYAIYDRLTQMAHTLTTTPDVDAGDAADARGGTGRDDAAAEQAAPEIGGEHAADSTLMTAEPAADPGSVRLVTGAMRTDRANASDDSGETTDTSDADDTDPRCMDELRADILADLLLTTLPTGHGTGDALDAITAHVQITLPVLTAAGVGNEPALLAGHGPIDADTARRLAADAPGWDRVMYHPHTGAPLAVDRYRHSEQLRRFLRVRDEHCRFPGCTQPPWRCDLDHTIDAAHGGPTSACNLANLCRRHHTVKHATPWTVRQLRHGILEWTSITGRRYTDRPAPTVQFVPEAAFRTPTPPEAPPF